ncbi:MAG: hypothetical protein JSU63_19165 [Phycisphaerales bacterium]|nr:MAG: hypothetical protein JSU63_19165 [Phycisphaerales bacterium]
MKQEPHVQQRDGEWRRGLLVVILILLIVEFPSVAGVVYIFQRFLPGVPTIHMLLALFIGFGLLSAAVLFIWWRHTRRPPPGYCRKCSYDLTGNTSGVCPECGTRITASTEDGV